MSAKIQGLYEFGRFRLNLAERSLRRGEMVVALTPKAFEALVALVESNGRVMERGELIQRVWPDGEAGEANLAVLISSLRKTLGERPGGGLYIETIPRQGYRFATPVQSIFDNEVESSSNDAMVSSAIGDESGSPSIVVALSVDDRTIGVDGQRVVSAVGQTALRRFGGKRQIWFLASAVALVAVVALGLAVLMRTTAVASARPHRLAILPLVNLKPDAATDFLGGSLADSITTKLGSIHSLIIRPSAYVSKYQGDVDPKRVARELNVDTLLTGTYIKEGDTLRITMQLVDAEKGEILARLPLDTKYEKLPTVHEQVAERILERLQTKLTFAESESFKQKGTENQQAYEFYLQGRDLYLKGKFLPAVPLFEDAVKMDPNFALAWAHLGRARNACASFNLRGRDLHLSAQAAYEQALTLSPNLIEAVIFKANLFTDTNRTEQAVPLLRHLLETNPNNAEAHWELGYAYRFAGMLPESIEECEKARAIDPLVKWGSSAFNSYLYTGQYEKFLGSLPADTDNAFLIFYRGLGHLYMKDGAGAMADFDRAYKSDPNLYTRIGKAMSYGLNSQQLPGLELLKDVERGVEQDGVGDSEGMYKVAQAYLMLGDRTAALRVLRRSIEQGFFCYDYFLNDPLLEPLRHESEFAELMEKAQLRHEQFRQAFF